MGMDLIGLGFTYDPDKTTDEDAIKRLLSETFHSGLTEAEFESAMEWDDIGVLYSCDDPDGVIVRLESGLSEYVELVTKGHRLSWETEIGDTSWQFVFTGGGSWGDDPFDGFTDLSLFLQWINSNDAAKALTNFVGPGIEISEA